MPAATNKHDLLTVTQKDFDKLLILIAPLSAEEAVRMADAEGITIKDTVGHRAHWIGLFLGWVADGEAGLRPDIPAKGYNWGQLVDYNETVRAAQRGLPWSVVRRGLEDNHAKLVAFIEARSEAELYHGGLPGIEHKWTLGRWAEASGPSHYRSAAKFIRGLMRAAKA